MSVEALRKLAEVQRKRRLSEVANGGGATTTTSTAVKSDAMSEDAASALLLQMDLDSGRSAPALFKAKNPAPPRLVGPIARSQSSTDASKVDPIGSSSSPSSSNARALGRAPSGSLGAWSDNSCGSGESPSMFVDADYTNSDMLPTAGVSLSGSSGGIANTLISEDTRGPPSPRPEGEFVSHAENFQPMRFKFLKELDTPRYATPDEAILDKSYRANIGMFPRRVKIAQHIERPPLPAHVKQQQQQQNGSGSNHGPPRSPYTYCYWLYPKVQRVMVDMMRATEVSRSAFVVVEEDTDLYLFIDWDAPKDCLKPGVHGSSNTALIAHSLGVTRFVLSSILGVSLACISDSCVLADSSSNSKISKHGHLPWPIKGTLALRSLMKEYEERTAAARDAGIPCAQPLFYDIFNEVKKKKEVRGILDPNIYSSIRLFRMIGAYKVDKKIPLRDARETVPTWTAQLALEAIDDGFMGLTSAMIHCRNSPAFWMPTTVRTPRLLEQADQETKPTDFRTLPITGDQRTLRTTIMNLLTKSGCASGTAWVLPSPSTPEELHDVDKRIDASIDSMFKLMYDQDGWKEETHAYRMQSAASSAGALLLGRLYAQCRKSPRLTAAVVKLWTHAYRPGKGFTQRMPTITPELFCVDFIINGAAAVNYALASKKPSEAFATLWRWRCEAEFSFWTTCTPPRRDERRAVLTKLGDDFVAQFLVEMVDKRAYNASKLFDIVFMDELASELFCWSGQSAMVYEVPDTAPLLGVPLGDRAELDKIYHFCFDTVCTRLQRLPELPVALIEGIGRRAKHSLCVVEAVSKTRERLGLPDDDMPSVEYLAPKSA